MNTYLISYDNQNPRWTTFIESAVAENRARWLANSTYLFNSEHEDAELLYEQLMDDGDFGDLPLVVVRIVRRTEVALHAWSEDTEGFNIYEFDPNPQNRRSGR